MKNITHTTTLKVSDVARHWGLSVATTRGLLKQEVSAPAMRNPDRYSWKQIWSVEQAGYVRPAYHERFRAPLLKPSEVQRRYFPDLTLRAIRDRAAKRTLPGVKLGSDWRFREHDIRQAAIHG